MGGAGGAEREERKGTDGKTHPVDSSAELSVGADVPGFPHLLQDRQRILFLRNGHFLQCCEQGTGDKAKDNRASADDIRRCVCGWVGGGGGGWGGR